MKAPAVEYDDELEELYIRISDSSSERTVRLGESVFLDIDSTGHVVGIDIDAVGLAIEDVEELREALGIKNAE